MAVNMAVNMGVIWASYWYQGQDVIDWGGIIQVSDKSTTVVVAAVSDRSATVSGLK